MAGRTRGRGRRFRPAFFSLALALALLHMAPQGGTPAVQVVSVRPCRRLSFGSLGSKKGEWEGGRVWLANLALYRASEGVSA